MPNLPQLQVKTFYCSGNTECDNLFLPRSPARWVSGWVVYLLSLLCKVHKSDIAWLIPSTGPVLQSLYWFVYVLLDKDKLIYLGAPWLQPPLPSFCHHALLTQEKYTNALLKGQVWSRGPGPRSNETVSVDVVLDTYTKYSCVLVCVW